MSAVLTVTDLRSGAFWQTRKLGRCTVDCDHQVSVYPDLRRQRFLGFGGAFTEAAAFCYQQLPPDRQRAFLGCYFGENGLGYTLGRVHMGSCDFALGNYGCLDSAREAADGVFHTERDEQYLLPMILAAQETEGRPIGLLLSPWSPPAFMKTNADMNHGGSLKPEYRELWAACIAKYVAFYRAKGCDVRCVTVQNEPAAVQTWDSCIYTAAEEGAFAAEALAPALEAAGCGDVGILAWDHNKELLVYRAAETMAYPGAEQALRGFAVHWYTGDHFDAVRLTRERWPDREIWFSEGCVEYSRFAGASALEKAERYAHDMIGNLNAGICASLDWNLLLDANGGPNHVGNFCEAPVMLCKGGKDFQIQSEYHYIGHFSCFIRPGAVCLGSSVWSTDLEVTAFENQDGSRVAVALNRTDRPMKVSLTQDGRESYDFTMAPRTIASLRWNL